MQASGRRIVIGGLLLVLLVAGIGCNGGAADTGGACAKKTRLFEDENYRLSDQVKGLEKQIADMKAAKVLELKESKSQEEARDAAMTFLMDQIAERDAQILKLQEKIAELEKNSSDAKKM